MRVRRAWAKVMVRGSKSETEEGSGKDEGEEGWGKGEGMGEQK